MQAQSIQWHVHRHKMQAQSIQWHAQHLGHGAMPCNWHWVQRLFREEILPSDKSAWLFSNLPRPHESTDLHQSTCEKMVVLVEMNELMYLAKKFFISYRLPFLPKQVKWLCLSKKSVGDFGKDLFYQGAWICLLKVGNACGRCLSHNPCTTFK